MVEWTDEWTERRKRDDWTDGELDGWMDAGMRYTSDYVIMQLC